MIKITMHKENPNKSKKAKVHLIQNLDCYQLIEINFKHWAKNLNRFIKTLPKIKITLTKMLKIFHLKLPNWRNKYKNYQVITVGFNINLNSYKR